MDEINAQCQSGVCPHQRLKEFVFAFYLDSDLPVATYCLSADSEKQAWQLLLKLMPTARNHVKSVKAA